METKRIFIGGAPVVLQRVRLRLSRLGPAARLTHLNQIEAIRRALRESKWPVAASQGKKPIPKVSFGPAISVGYESTCEYCDVQMAARLDLKTAPDLLAPHLPDGYGVMSVKSIPRMFPSLEDSINLGRYEVVSPHLEGRQADWEKFWSTESFPVVKKKAERDVVVDARPCVKSWTLQGDKLELLLRFGPGRTLKPERIVQAICRLEDSAVDVAVENPQIRVKRTHFYFEKENGEFIEP